MVDNPVPASTAERGADAHPRVAGSTSDVERAAKQSASRWAWGTYIVLPATLAGALLLGAVYWPRRQHARTLSPVSASAQPTASTQPEGSIALAQPYPRARWRIAPRGDLANVVLWISHILVRHRNSEPSTPPFGPPGGWSVLPPPPQRDAAEAARRANEIAEEASKDPSRFAELAKTFSDDVTTRDRGGSVGGVSAGSLSGESGVLDALAHMKPGEVSRVIETRFGFHVLLRRIIPAPVQLSGRHIVIGHDSAEWLKFRQREGKASHRTREQALNLARELVERARAQPDLFGRLIAAYSEHRDAADAGDIGVWSNREPAVSPRLIDALAELREGQFSDPVETPLGFEIIERTQVEPREPFAAATIRIRFEPTAADDQPRSKHNVAALSDSILKTLQKEPTRFGSFQQQYCCITSERWTRGRGSPIIASAVEKLSMGAILRRPVIDDTSFVIVKRLDPASLEPDAAIDFELPAPAAPNIEHVLASTSPKVLAESTRKLGRAVRPSLELSKLEETAYDKLHDNLAQVFENKPPDEFVQSFRDFLKETENLLGPQKAERYRAGLNANVEKMLYRN
jgi:PPIC-type PPIASE domain